MAEQKFSHKNFSKTEAIRFGWQMAIKHFRFFVVALLIVHGISWGLSFIYQPFIGNSDILIKLLGIILFLVGWYINLEIGFAMLTIYFKIAEKKKTTVKELFAYFDWDIISRYFLVFLLYGLLILVGTLLFIIPGIYFATKYWFAGYIYVDKRTGVLEAFKESAKLTQGIKWQLFLLGLLQILIQIAGLLALVVGLFVAIPINYLSDIYVYRKLSAK
jgi:uncharacterized membrane protein